MIKVGSLGGARMAPEGSRGEDRHDGRILAGRVALKYPESDDFQAWARLREESRSFLARWEPTWTPDELSRGTYRRRLKLYARSIRADEAYPYFIFRRADGALLGGLTLSNLRRGAAQSCTLGYWIGAPYARQGYMSEALRGVIGHVFARLGLHRLEAACLPSNAASRALLVKSGFREEGYARAYLKINGIWEDHVLYAMLENDPRP